MEGIIAFFVIAWIVVSLAVGLHASDNGKTSFWGLAVFFFGIFGLIFYAISLASD